MPLLVFAQLLLHRHALLKVMDLDQFLQREGLSRYVEAFTHRGVTLQDLLFVEDENDLKELGVDLCVHRRKLLTKLKVLQQHDAPPTTDQHQRLAEHTEHTEQDAQTEQEQLLTPTKDDTQLQLHSNTDDRDDPVPSEEDMLGTAWNEEYNLDSFAQHTAVRRVHLDSELREDFFRGSDDHHHRTPTLHVHDSILDSEQQSIVQLETTIAAYRAKYIAERADKLQSTIENERAMIDVQVECAKEKTGMTQEIEQLESALLTSTKDSDALRHEINRLSKRLQAFEDNSDYHKKLCTLQQEITTLTQLVQDEQNTNDTLNHKWQAAETMKKWLTAEWESTEQEALRYKQQLVEGSNERVLSVQLKDDVDELLVFLSSKLKVVEEDRGLRLAVKEEWSRLLMDSFVMRKWFVMEREVGMVASWVLKEKE